MILLGLLCLIGCFLVPLTLLTTQRYQQEVTQNRSRSLASTLASQLAVKKLLSLDAASLQRARVEIKSLMVINPEVDVYLLDPQGNVLASSGAPGDIKQSRVALAPVRAFLRQNALLPILGDNPRAPGKQAVFSAAPFPPTQPRLSTPPRGYVYVVLGADHFKSAAKLLQKSYVLQSSAWALAAIFVLVFAAGMLSFRLLTHRLRWLTNSMETFRDQNYLKPETVLTARLFTPWPGIVHRRDEIDRLGMMHLEMTNRIRGQILALAQADRQRFEMVGSISHDLRTPLAALQGYLETLLLKEGQLTAQEQRRYLQVAARQSERLAKLVGELFDLAQLDSGESQVQLELISLSELVQDIVQQGQLAAQQKNIRLQALLPSALPFVSADIALIERVLDNLIENALRYTPEGGLVVVSLVLQGTSQSGMIEVRVADTGSGIRPEDLPHIFDRFYREPGQPKRPGSAGLGLAIAKRILELHGSRIEAQSVVDEGTSFLFRLPVQKA